MSRISQQAIRDAAPLLIALVYQHEGRELPSHIQAMLPLPPPQSKAAPAERSPQLTVYRHYDAEDRLLYVGLTCNVKKRSSSHRTQSIWWPQVARVESEDFATEQRARYEEHQLIQALCPLYNVEHSPEPEAARERIAELWLASRDACGGTVTATSDGDAA